MPKYGANPDKSLSPRACEVCGETFQPYRDAQRTCRRQCYDRLPDRKAATAAVGRRVDVRERKNQARRVATNPDRRLINLRQAIRRYGITLEQYQEMLARQAGLCTLCGEPPDPDGIKASSRLHVDHDHVTGAVRELLCNRCNMGVGYFRDDPDLLHAAAEYIERHRGIV
jgi:hypothetical protein